MNGQYEHTPSRCKYCGSAPRLHTMFGLFWYECDNYECARTREAPGAFTDHNKAFLAWNAEQEKEA